MFDTARASLAGLYQEGSMLTFEGQKFMGPAQVRGAFAPPARPTGLWVLAGGAPGA